MVRLGAVGHGRVGVVPVALDAEALELLALHVDPVLGELRGTRARNSLTRRRVVLAPGPWRGTAPRSSTRSAGRGSPSPARSWSRSPASAGSRHHDVLQDLVQRVADVDVAVGVGRAVVQDELGPALGGLAQLARRGRSRSSARAASARARGRPALIGKSVLGRNSVSLQSRPVGRFLFAALILCHLAVFRSSLI